MHVHTQCNPFLVKQMSCFNKGFCLLRVFILSLLLYITFFTLFILFARLSTSISLLLLLFAICLVYYLLMKKKETHTHIHTHSGRRRKRRKCKITNHFPTLSGSLNSIKICLHYYCLLLFIHNSLYNSFIVI